MTMIGSENMDRSKTTFRSPTSPLISSINVTNKISRTMAITSHFFSMFFVNDRRLNSSEISAPIVQKLTIPVFNGV
jgi:hypothetical protein